MNLDEYEAMMQRAAAVASTPPCTDCRVLDVFFSQVYQKWLCPVCYAKRMAAEARRRHETRVHAAAWANNI